MCGIVGYVGEDKVQEILLEGLRKLEYRGYDSSGIVVLENKIEICKKEGKINNLKGALELSPLNGRLGIGHTRWATHGKPSDNNSHPHLSQNKKFAVVHNGIIENYRDLKEELEEKGYKFSSETDTEVIVQLLEYLDTGDLKETVQKVIKKLSGAFALGIVSENEPDKIIAVRVASPLIIGIGKKGNFIASDIPAILEHTRDVYVLENGEMAIIKKNSIDLMTIEGNPIKKDILTIQWDNEDAQKGGYEHFMLKEIFEQPKSLSNTIRGRISSDNEKVIFEDFKLTIDYLRNIEKINIVACGTSYHAGLVGKYLIEKMVRIPVEVEIASEFRYNDPIISEKDLTIVISQSGETADTMAALLESKSKNSKVLSITNTVGSSIARESDEVIYTWAGPEIAVASTKAYTSQVTALYLFTFYLTQCREMISSQEMKKILIELQNIPNVVEETLKTEEKVKFLSKEISKSNNLFFLGRGVDSYATLEGSLKLKEVSYIHSESYAAGELKHGTLALIEENLPVITVSTQPNLNEKTVSNVIEVQARGAKTIGIGFKENKEMKRTVDEFLEVPTVSPLLSSLIVAIPMQLLAYYCSIARNIDPDKPKNLAKSVTVE